MPNIHSYSSIYNMGHKAVRELLDGPVIVEEKIDGSQFSIAVLDGELSIRSKGANIYPEAPPKMFSSGVATAQELAGQLVPGWVYRGEFLAKPKHNVLAYDRVPKKHFCIFDISVTREQDYLDPDAKKREAERLGLECVPELYRGMVSSLEQFRELLETESVLGGQKIEGVVVKPLGYNVFGQDKKVLMGKFVSEAFKEVHQGEFRKENPTSGDIIQVAISKYRTPARWSKAVQHLSEAGTLEGSPRDIGWLIKEVPDDILRECGDEIKELVFNWAWKHIKRGVTAGLPQWYKEELLKQQFEKGEE